MSDSVLGPRERQFLATARRATLATTKADGGPRLVPICFVVTEADSTDGLPRLHSPLDEKPKRSTDPHDLARVRDLLVLPRATLLVDRWSEDWERLGWLRLEMRAEILEPDAPERAEHEAAVRALRAKYPQYASHRLEDRPMLRFTVLRAVSWGDLGPDAGRSDTAGDAGGVG
ncbi:MAG TPA: TIGR03668 family PPOX class F420-dependent oxidoreductase [Candidatus Limnocylindrales bacterium]|nr:TIGR03668 family PPOX class F420-dependent oxidoreductase [Candidatus Limnocylindrales bacterium]